MSADPQPTSSPGFALGFDLARQARDPAFRDHLRSIGHQSDGSTSVVPVAAGEMDGVLGRFDNRPGRSLLAVEDKGRPFGWRFLWLEDAT